MSKAPTPAPEMVEHPYGIPDLPEPTTLEEAYRQSHWHYRGIQLMYDRIRRLRDGGGRK